MCLMPLAIVIIDAFSNEILKTQKLQIAEWRRMLAEIDGQSQAEMVT